MSFASPLWLFGLLPWAAAALYLLWGRRKRRDVPFLHLWRGPAAVERAKWKVSAPPLALALAIAAVLAAVLGAARPGARRGAGAGGAVGMADTDPPGITILLDRGVTMSARGRGDLRFREAGRAAADEIRRVFGSGTPVHPWTVPGTPSGSSEQAAVQQATRGAATDTGAWAGSLARVLPTALDTREIVRQQVRRRLADTGGPVVVVSDTDLGLSEADARRVIQVVPETAVRNVGITRLAARATPWPQVLVRVRNDSAQTSATLRVTTPGAGGAAQQRTIDLPPDGSARDYFFDFKTLAGEVSAELVVKDDLDADNKAWVVRESAWPVVEVAKPVGPLQRLIEVYQSLHPSGDGSRRVRLVGRAEDLAAGESGVIIPAAPSALPASAGASAAPDFLRPTRVEPHPITDAVRDWSALDLPVVAATARPPADWPAVLSAGERPLVAVHESADTARQVWVALDAARWADRPEYVAFWTAALDWAGGTDGADGAEGTANGPAGGGTTYASSPLDQYDPSWRPVAGDDPRDRREPGLWPGLYERPGPAGSGGTSPAPLTTPSRHTRRAFNTAPVPIRPRAGDGTNGDGAAWRRKLRSLRSGGPGWHDLTPAPLLAAAGCALLAAATWRRRDRR